MNKNKSFWLSKLKFKINPPLKENLKTDIAIIGGGFTGLSTAYNLIQQDKNLKIAILEKDFIGFGASGRNAGFSMTLFGFTLSFTAFRFGKNSAKEAHQYMVEAVNFLYDLIKKNKLDSDYEHNGFIRVATNSIYEKRIKKEIEFAQKLGIKEIEWIEKSELQKRIISPIFLGGWWERNSGILNPAKHIMELKKLLQKNKILIYEQTPVLKIHKNKRIVIETPSGNLEAEKLVIATNAYSFFIPKLKYKQTPIFTYIVLTEPLSRKHFSEIGWKNREGIEDARNFVHYYRLTKDNRLLMGGRDIQLSYGFALEHDHNQKIFAQLEEDIIKTFPSLKGIKIEYKWGGPVSATLDFAPAIGFLGDKNIIYSFGCMGHGVALSHYNGLTISELLLDKQTSRTNIFFVNRKVIPFPPEPLRYVVSKAIKEVLKLEDKIIDKVY